MTYGAHVPSTLALANGTAATNPTPAAPQTMATVAASGGTITYQNGLWVCSSPAGGQAHLDRAVNTPQMVSEVMFDFTNLTTAPTADVSILHHVVSGIAGVRVTIGTTGKIALRNAAGGGGAIRWGPSAASVLGTRFRVYMASKIAADITHGEIHFAYYSGANADGATATATFDAATGENAGIANYTMLVVGKFTSAPALVGGAVEYVQWDDATMAKIGPYVAANTPPVANAGPDLVVESDADFALNGASASDPDGTVAGTVWSWDGGSALVSPTSLNGASGHTPIVMDDTTYAATLTVTDDDGATATDTRQVLVKGTGVAIIGTAGTYAPTVEYVVT